MKVDKNITKRLSHAAFVTNVLDGGRVLPLLSINKEIDKYIYSIELPGVNPDDFIVEISNGALLLFHQMWFKEDLEIPYLVNRMMIPQDVNIDGISAEFRNGKLQIILPVDELSQGYHRNVEISKY